MPALTVTQTPATFLREGAVIQWVVTIDEAGYKYLRFHTDTDDPEEENFFANQFAYVSSNAQKQSGISGQKGDRAWQFVIANGKTYTFSFRARPDIIGFKTINITIEKKPDSLGDKDPETSTHTITVTNNPVLVAPDAPSGLSLTVLSAVSIRLNWTDNSDNEFQFNIYRARSASDTFERLPLSAAEGATSFTDIGLQSSTTYYYKVSAENNNGESALTSAVSATTSVAPAIPTAPSNLTATTVSSVQINLEWDDNSANETGFQIFRSSISGGPHTLIDEVGAGETSYNDLDVAPNTTNYYEVKAFNTGGVSAASNEASATTPPVSPTTGTASPFYMDPRARVSSVQVADSLMIFNDYGRAHVLADNTWSLAGMKPLLTAATISDGGTGGTDGYTGTFTAYLCVKFGDRKRSIPSPVSNSLTITNRRITIVPPNDGTTVTMRDTFKDLDGNEVTRGLTWEIYLYEQNLEIPVRIVELPITTLTYTTAAADTIADLDSIVKRPMETSRESQIGPAAAYAKVYADRVHSWGERVFKPDSTQLSDGARLTITNGDTTCTVANTDGDSVVDFLEALYLKEMWVNGKSTGWFVVDVEGTTLYLFNMSPEKHAQGWQLNDAGGAVSYLDFAFAPVSNRMSRSAKFAGEANGNLTLYYQSTPPLAEIGAELSPDDNQEPIAAEAARGVLFVAKRSKWLFVEGGAGLDESPDGSDRPTVQLLADNVGVLSARSVVQDGDGNILCLADSGPIMVSRAGIRRLGLINGTTFLLKDYFEIGSAQGAIAAWFQREDFYVCAGLNKIGNTSFRDGFIYEARTGRIVFFDLPRRITALLPSQTNDGDFQLIFGDDSGYIGVFLQKGVFTDNINFMEADPFGAEQSYAWNVTTGVHSTAGNMTIGRYRMSVKQNPLTTPVTITTAIDAQPQTSNPTTFAATVSAAYMTNDSRPFYRIDKYRTQAARFRVSGTSSRSELVQLREMLVEINDNDSGQDQN